MISISAWIKGNTWKDGSGGDVDTIVRKGDSTPNNYNLCNLERQGNVLSGRCGYRRHSRQHGFECWTVVPRGGHWDGTTAKIYVNGVLDNSPGTAKAAPIGTDTRPLYIGGRSGTDCFDGMIRDVRIYNRPLTATELVQGAGLVGWWKFAEGSGTSAADSSGMGNTATLSGERRLDQRLRRQ